MTKYADWPEWLRVLVMTPHAILLFVATWLWWPRSKEGNRAFLYVLLYLAAFYLVMRYVFNFRLSS
jgi:hypothetical protein